MTQKEFEKAKEIEERVKHLTEIIDSLSKYDYKLEPPTRMSNFNLYRYHEPHITFNETEVIVIRKALEDERSRLQQEFGRL